MEVWVEFRLAEAHTECGETLRSKNLEFSTSTKDFPSDLFVLDIPGAVTTNTVADLVYNCSSEGLTTSLGMINFTPEQT